MTGPFDPRLRILSYNTHVGTTILGALSFLLDNQDPHLVVLQEVQSPLARRRAQVLLPPPRWSAVGTRPASTGRGSAGTLIFARSTVLTQVGESNDLVTPFRDRFPPERRCTTGQFLHRPSGQVLDIGAVHLWTLKNANVDPAVRPQHATQLRAHVDSAVLARRGGRLPFRIGDFNEPMQGNGATSAEQAMASAGLRPARRATDHQGRPDEIFAPDELTHDGYRAVRPLAHFPGVEGPHRALVLDVAIPPRTGDAVHMAAGQGAGRHP